MKHQQPQTNNGQQQGHKQASDWFRENYVEFLPTADKESQQSESTESSQHNLLEDGQARAKSGDVHVQRVGLSVTVDMTSKCESVSVPIETVLGLSDTQRGHKLGLGGYIQVHRRAGIPPVLSSYGDHSCSAIFSRFLKLWLLYTLSDEISAVWHLGTEVTGVAFVTWSPWYMWTIAPWIRFRFLMIESLLHNYFV